jgi:RHS repeat-associated protein
MTYDYNKVNQLLSSTNPSKVFTYDNDGNMSQGYTPEGYVFTAVYDAENRLKSVEYTDGGGVLQKTEYLYSGDGFLIEMKKYENIVLTSNSRFVRDGFLAVQERDSSNSVIREYVWGLNMEGGIGGLLNLKQSGQDYSYLYDGKGNVTALTDSSQSVAATYTYDTFGNLMSKTGTLHQLTQFSTKNYDEKTGLSYYGYRFYSPVLGRWINRDPLGEAGGINLYGFVRENPANILDALGLESKWSRFWKQTGEVIYTFVTTAIATIMPPIASEVTGVLLDPNFPEAVGAVPHIAWESRIKKEMVNGEITLEEYYELHDLQSQNKFNELKRRYNEIHGNSKNCSLKNE